MAVGCGNVSIVAMKKSREYKMIIWILSSIACLAIDHFTHWTTFELFSAICLFGIFMKIRD